MPYNTSRAVSKPSPLQPGTNASSANHHSTSPNVQPMESTVVRTLETFSKYHTNDKQSSCLPDHSRSTNFTSTSDPNHESQLGEFATISLTNPSSLQPNSPTTALDCPTVELSVPLNRVPYVSSRFNHSSTSNPPIKNNRSSSKYNTKCTLCRRNTRGPKSRVLKHQRKHNRFCAIIQSEEDLHRLISSYGLQENLKHSNHF